jgi:hypothetical protein
MISNGSLYDSISCTIGSGVGECEPQCECRKEWTSSSVSEEEEEEKEEEEEEEATRRGEMVH